MTPQEVFAPWAPAQRVVGRLAHEALATPPVLRTTGLLEPDLADQVTDWYTGTATAPPPPCARPPERWIARPPSCRT